MADHPYDPNCGCPGCQYLWAAEQAFAKFGPPPVIGTFDPKLGDFGRDCDHPLSMYRVWTSHGWHPYFEVVPLQTIADLETSRTPGQALNPKHT